MTAQTELERCPFCGGENIGYTDVPGKNLHQFDCLGCFASAPTKRTRDEAAAAWNRRAPLTDERIEELFKESDLECLSSDDAEAAIKFARAIERDHGIKEQQG